MIYDDLETRLTAEYELFLFALAGRYQQMRAPGVEVTPKAIIDLQVDAYGIGKTFIDIASREIDDYLRPLQEDGSDELQRALVIRKKEVEALIHRMVIENVRQVASTARVGQRNVAKLLTGNAGAIGQLVQNAMGKFDFRVTDTSGRKWVASLLFRVVVRDFAYQSFIDHQVALLTAAGQTWAQTSRGEVFALKDIEEVRRRYFHVNSHATIEAYVPS